MPVETLTVLQVLGKVTLAIRTTLQKEPAGELANLAQAYINAADLKPLPDAAQTTLGADEQAKIQPHLVELDAHAAGGDLTRVLHHSFEVLSALPGHPHWHPPPKPPGPALLARSLAGKPKWRPGSGEAV